MTTLLYTCMGCSDQTTSPKLEGWKWVGVDGPPRLRFPLCDLCSGGIGEDEDE